MKEKYYSLAGKSTEMSARLSIITEEIPCIKYFKLLIINNLLLFNNSLSMSDYDNNSGELRNDLEVTMERGKALSAMGRYGFSTYKPLMATKNRKHEAGE